MEIPIQLTLRGVFVGAFGLLLCIVGIYFIRQSWTRNFGIGVFLIGVGTASLGATNGFSDYSPLGKALYKIGLISFGVGFPLALYAFYTGSF